MYSELKKITETESLIFSHEFLSSKDSQIQELKVKFSDFSHKANTTANPSYDMIEFSMQLDNTSLKIPISM